MATEEYMTSQEYSATIGGVVHNVTVAVGGVPNTIGVYNVKAYGATGDGVANDTTFIQAAIDAAIAAGGGEVVIPRGRYLISSTIYVRNTNSIDDIRITAHGAEILTGTGFSGHAVQFGYSGESSSNIAWHGGAIRTSNSTADFTISSGLHMLNSYRCRVVDVNIRGFQRGIWAEAEDGRGCVYNRIEPRIIYDCYWGIYMSSAGSGWTNDNLVIGGSIYYSTALNAVDCSGGAGLYVKPDGGASRLIECNHFIGVSIENGSAMSDANTPDAIAGAPYYSEFIGVRMEGFDGSGGTLKYINLTAGEGNSFRGGNGVFEDSFYDPKFASFDGMRRHRMIGEWGVKSGGGPVLELFSRGTSGDQALFLVAEATAGDTFQVFPVGFMTKPGAAPTSPVEGQVYYDSAAHKLKVYTGAGWETVTSA